jgi:pimeloyl-ACP methyl ester carboxylesterase
MFAPVLRSAPVDGFRLAYERAGTGPPVVLLHGWPGDSADYARVAPLLREHADVVVPDLRGFGGSDKHAEDPPRAYSAAAQTRSVLGLLDELDIPTVVIAGYDIGSRVAQTIAQTVPDRVRALVLSPPLPGAGDRVLSAAAQQEFWYQAFHQLDLAAELIDGNPAAVRAYLQHFWSHWSGPEYRQPDGDLEQLVEFYAAPGAFTASIGWYRAGSGTVARSLAEVPPDAGKRLAVPTTVLWPEHDPLFPLPWSDRVGEYFAAATVRPVAGVGHFVPLEAPQDVAAAVLEALDASGGD